MSEDTETIPEVVKRVVEKMRVGADHFLAEGDEVMPAIFAVNVNKAGKLSAKAVPVGPMMNHGAAGKEILFHIMNKLIQSDEIDLMILVTEAWTVQKSMDEMSREDALEIRPSEHPDKEEVVLFNVLTKTQQFVAHAKIIRAENGTGKTEQEITYFTIDEESEGTLVRDKEDVPKLH